MRRNPFALAAMLAMLATGLEAHAVCTAGNPNASVIESTPTSTFTDNANGTVTHNLTGLIWKQCAEGLSGAGCATGGATTFTWANALIQAKNANFAGQTDWRLPNLKELESIVESCGYNPSINQTLFPATPASYFWSSSSFVPYPAYAWIVYFGYGYTDASDKAGSYYARLVRGGQSFDAFDAQAADTTPNAFSFTAQTGVPLSTVTTSNTITVAGITAASPISIVGGTYSINGGAYTAAAGTVNNGNTVTVRQTSSASYSTLTTATLTIGGVSGAFNVTTLAAPLPPPPPPPPSPQVNLAVNGNSAAEVTLANPVTVTYQIVGCQNREMYLVLNAPAMGIVWSYLNAAGQWIPLPANLADITPFSAAGPADGGYTLYSGTAPVGNYDLYLGCDFVTNGHLDYTGGTSINGVYDYVLVHVN